MKEHLTLKPVLDDSEQLYTVEYPELGISAFAYTRQELTEEIEDDK